MGRDLRPGQFRLGRFPGDGRYGQAGKLLEDVVEAPNQWAIFCEDQFGKRYRFLQGKAVHDEWPVDAPPRPPHWGGYRCLPTEIEFWQGRADRLHDRLVYKRRGTGWTLERLAP